LASLSQIVISLLEHSTDHSVKIGAHDHAPNCKLDKPRIADTQAAARLLERFSAAIF